MSLIILPNLGQLALLGYIDRIKVSMQEDPAFQGVQTDELYSLIVKNLMYAKEVLGKVDPLCYYVDSEHCVHYDPFERTINVHTRRKPNQSLIEQFERMGCEIGKIGVEELERTVIKIPMR